MLLALSYVAKNKDTFLENYWLKNKRAVERGRNEAPHAWVVPAGQRRTVEAAELVNLFRRQGVEVHTANAGFTAGGVQVAAGDYILRMDQPYRTLDRHADGRAVLRARPIRGPTTTPAGRSRCCATSRR